MTSVPSQLACPACAGPLRLADGDVACARCGPVGRRAGAVWDFVKSGDYAASFGRQWTAFSATQVDSRNATSISRQRFAQVTGWGPRDVAGRRVLDAGCGAGRFSEIAVGLGGDVTALDLSAAAYAASANLDSTGATVVRGDLLRPPLRDEWFDAVFSIGVLQHTPDPAAAARHLVRLLRPDGELVVWMYERRWYTPLMPKAVLRRFARRLSPERVEQLSAGLVRAFTPVARVVGALPPSSRRAARGLLPIASYWGELPLSPDQQREWSLLDTHDWLSPAYDLPLTERALEQALSEAGAVGIRRIDVPGLGMRAERRA